MSRPVMKSRTLPLLVLPLVAAFALATPAEAQDVRYTTVTKAEFGGALGRMMSVVPGIDTEVRETTWISGPRMRTDTESSSTIMDLEAGRFTTLDHETRTFWSFDLADFGRSMGAVAEAMDEGMEGARGESPARQAEMGADRPTRRLEIDLSTDRTGDTREISGFRTERVFVTLELEGEELQAAEGAESPEGLESREGKMVLLTELWVTDENLVPVPEEMDLEGYREMTADAMDDWAAMEQAFASDPELQVAFDRSRAALADLEGTAVESTLFWVLVPPEKEFDRMAALADRDRSLSADVADAAKEGAKESAKDAAKRSLGRIGGLFGGGDDEKEEEEVEEEPELTQQTFLRIKTLLEEVDRGPVPASTFEVPEGYTERELPTGGDPGGD